MVSSHPAGWAAKLRVGQVPSSNSPHRLMHLAAWKSSSPTLTDSPTVSPMGTSTCFRNRWTSMETGGPSAATGIGTRLRLCVSNSKQHRRQCRLRREGADVLTAALGRAWCVHGVAEWGWLLNGRIVGPGVAIGTENFAGCYSGAWTAWMSEGTTTGSSAALNLGFRKRRH